MLLKIFKFAAVVLVCAGSIFGAAPVSVDFFYEPGCRDCERIEAEVLPRIEERFGDACTIEFYDIGVESNFLYLLKLEDAAGYSEPERGYLAVGKKHVFGSSPDLEALFARVEEVREESSVQDSGRASGNVARERFHGFTLSAVLLAGLLDGINPCAVSTLVFFMSLLAVSKVRNRQLLLTGISFCLASFLTYLALGFGLLRILHLFSGFEVVRGIIEWGMVAVLLIFSLLSFRDAVRFRKSGDSRDVTLQLPVGIKKQIHRVMRGGLGSASLIAGGLITGTVVTALESVCTGQVYVPTLVLILKNSAFSAGRAWLYLVSYNLMFVLPIVLVFAAVYRGLRTDVLLAWSRKNVVFSKSLLALFFLGMAGLIVFL